MFAGASAEANVCISVPSEQVVDGVWLIRESFSSRSNPVRFAIA